VVSVSAKPPITSPAKAIRQMCVECMGGHDGYIGWKDEVVPPYSPYGLIADCTAPRCPLYPFRFGKNPFHSRSKGGA
jgi:hypothetical protein